MDERATPPDRAPWARRGDAERQSLRNRGRPQGGAGVLDRRPLQRPVRRSATQSHRVLVRLVPLLALDAARLRIDRLAGGADPPSAAAHGRARLEPARGLAGALVAEAAALERGAPLSPARIVTPRAGRQEVAGLKTEAVAQALLAGGERR